MLMMKLHDFLLLLFQVPHPAVRQQSGNVVIIRVQLDNAI